MAKKQINMKTAAGQSMADTAVRMAEDGYVAMPVRRVLAEH